MRKTNWRLVIAGILFILLAAAFYFVMLTMAPSSTDPAELMRITGQAAGTVGGVSVVLISIGLIGKKG
ncbi:MAG: hypothetical protein HYZ23_06755 [Chloroflexi bacterium]|nr:hypothetical protein [Chloroflexota bacterium]